MSMTVVVTRNVSNRMRGFLASSMLELAPGVYSAPRISPAVRERIWKVVADWFTVEQEASAVMLWADPQMPGGQNIQVLGLPPIELIEMDGLIVSRRPGSDDGAL
jgi:CRISPR-associated endoribonuclease Cas2, subtype I-E/ECOLI